MKPCESNAPQLMQRLVSAVSISFVLALGSCATPAPTSGNAPRAPDARGIAKGVETGDLNRTIDPCTDFYEFANGTWRAHNPIPALMPRWSRRFAAHEANKLQVQNILESVSQRNDWPAGSTEQLLSDHYASCMDEAGIDAAGLKPLAPLLAEIDGIRNPADVQHVIRRLHELAIPAPFGIAGGMDYHEPGRFIANVVGGGLGLPDRDYYLNPEPRFADARTKYQAHVTNILRLGGMPDVAARAAADSIVALEKRLAAASLDSAAAADQAATDHKTTFAALQRLVPHVDWEVYFNDAALPLIDLNVAEPKLMQQVDKELAETPVAVWQAYLRWQLLDAASPSLARAFVEASFNFHDKFLGNATAMKPRAQRCTESTEALLGDAVGKKYVDRYFPPAAKAKARALAGALLAELKRQVVDLSWMAPETKTKALAKLATQNVQLGYPDTWKNYSIVTIRRKVFWANVAALRKFNVADDRNHIGKPTGDYWRLAPSSPDSYLDFQLNQLVLPAGFLQPPAFDLNASDAVNYGAMGVALAHDMTHHIDPAGAEFDDAGRPNNWWTEADRNAFNQRGQCVSEQFENYFIEPGVHHQGQRVLSEAVADLAGVGLAYQALERSMQHHPLPVIDGFTPEQQFFIAWAQVSGAAMRLEAQRQLINGDPHPVPKFRVIGALSNSPLFQQAFSCKAGSAMVRPVEKRCAVW